MADPRRDLPRVINTAMSVAISGFVLMNISLATVLPLQRMRDSNVVAVVRCLTPYVGESILIYWQGFRPRDLRRPWRFDIFVGGFCI